MSREIYRIDPDGEYDYDGDDCDDDDYNEQREQALWEQSTYFF